MKYEMIRKYVYLLILLIEILSIIFKVYYVKIAAIILLIMGVELAFRYRNNIMLFFIFIMFLYCNYSFIISKYIGSGTNNLVGVYNQIKFNDTKAIGLYAILLFNTIISLIIGKKQENDFEKNFFLTNVSIQCCNFISFWLVILITIILMDYLFFNFFTFGREIYEYCLMLFLFGFYFSKKSNKKIYRNLLVVLMLISMLENTIDGGRIITLQPILIFLICNYIEKVNWKNTLIVLIIRDSYIHYFRLIWR